MGEQLKFWLQYYRDATVNSYAQMFFSNNRWFALLLLLASFVDPFTGLSGLIALLIAVAGTHWFKFDTALGRSGAYTYNSLMVGLAVGVYYTFNIQLLVILLLMSVFTLLITVWMANITLKSNTPFLSLPFIAGVWVVILSTRNYAAIGLSERGIYTINEMWSYGGQTLVDFYQKLNHLPIPAFFDVYLKSLGAIYFQYNILAGILIAAGLLLHSRISFVLSLVGFTTGYLFYHFLEGGYSEMMYSYIGFNFILSAIAIGGFFLIPSGRSFLLVIICTPLIAILISALGSLVSVYQLPLYSLPFTLMVMLLLFVLRLRYEGSKPQLVLMQQYAPEKNLYKHLYRKERFQNETYFHIHFPFFGTWYISQGHDGTITHLEDWKYAWDFVVTDDNQKTFKLPGTDVTDFYCYNLPVLAPAAGYVAEVLDEVADNNIGDVNREQNWGNAIVIKHGEFMFSKLTHLKAGSLKVKAGDYVKKGEVIASCGNSGRSPEPHIHFQLQATPYIGSKTLRYPISYYVSQKNNVSTFHSFDFPKQGEYITRVATTPLLKSAFQFIPGEEFMFECTNENGKKETIKWEVFTDAWNNSYLYCHASKSTAWFVNNETLHYFTDFEGDKNSMLYAFYLGAHKILMGFYPQMELTDLLPVEGFFKGPVKYLQDIFAPFYLFLRGDFAMKFTFADEQIQPRTIIIESSATASAGKTLSRNMQFKITVTENHIAEFTVTEKGKTRTAKWIN